MRLVLPCLLLAGLAAACGRAEPPADPTPASTEPRTAVDITDERARAAGIETAAVRFIDRSDPLTAAGVVTFDERRTQRLGSLVEGVVGDIRVQPGDRVAAGAIVARLHSHAVHDAWAAYFKAQADQRRLEAELAYARTNESRAAQLVDARALSPQELERARADVTTAAEALTGGRAEVLRTEQDLAHYGITARPDANARENEDVPVVATLGGTVIERLVTPGTAVTPGTPLLLISDLTRVWVTAEIDEALVGRVAAGSEAAITARAYPGERFTGTLTAVGDIIDATTRRVRLRIEAPNPDRKLKPQMFVSIAIGAASPRRMLVVPSGAVQAMDGEQVVFVRSGERFARRAVVTGADRDGQVEIVSGLSEGEVVATAGAFLLKSDLVKPAGDEEP